MKKVVILGFMVISLFSLTTNQIYTYYKVGNYKKACQKGAILTRRYKKDENLLSIVALSCVKVDYLNTSINLSKSMINSGMARNNASYIASLFLMKKLLLQFVYDGTDLTNLRLPKSNHILSVVFENISHNNYRLKDNKYTIKDGKYTYTLEEYIDNKNYKILLKKLKGPKVIEQHIYW